MTLRSAVKSMRLRTLPLSLSGVILGAMLSAADYRINALTVVFLLLTTVSLQILSNMSNELGDALSGTDTGDRQGPQYSLQSGEITPSDMKILIGVFVGLCIAFGLLMIRFSFGTVFCLEGILLCLLGGGAIIAAMRYTLGPSPYGYRGLGDFYVFLFFGIVSVMGSHFVCAHTVGGWRMLLPASAIGFFSMGVLNINNIRDMKTDAENRVTVAIRLGEKRAKCYQTVLIAGGWACMIAYTLLRFPDPWHWLFLLTLPLYVIHLVGVWKNHDRELDKYLPMLVMATFAFSILAGIGNLVFLFK